MKSLKIKKKKILGHNGYSSQGSTKSQKTSTLKIKDSLSKDPSK